VNGAEVALTDLAIEAEVLGEEEEGGGAREPLPTTGKGRRSTVLTILLIHLFRLIPRRYR